MEVYAHKTFQKAFRKQPKKVQEQFFKMIALGEIIDGKTIMGANAFWHLRNDNLVKIGLDYYNKERMDKALRLANEVIDEGGEDE